MLSDLSAHLSACGTCYIPLSCGKQKGKLVFMWDRELCGCGWSEKCSNVFKTLRLS